MEKEKEIRIFDCIMKFLRNIVALVIVFSFVAGCAKEVITPAGNLDVPTKKNGETDQGVIYDQQNDDIDVEDGYSDGDITDPENDLDFD